MDVFRPAGRVDHSSSGVSAGSTVSAANKKSSPASPRSWCRIQARHHLRFGCFKGLAVYRLPHLGFGRRQIHPDRPLAAHLGEGERTSRHRQPRWRCGEVREPRRRHGDRERRDMSPGELHSTIGVAAHECVVQTLCGGVPPLGLTLPLVLGFVPKALAGFGVRGPPAAAGCSIAGAVARGLPPCPPRIHCGGGYRVAPRSQPPRQQGPPVEGIL